jgi:hypothetical protein
MYKAVFIDMDGTLLTSQHTITDTTKQTIQQLIRMGILVIPISARPLHGMLPFTAPVFDDEKPVVSLNGSYIFHQQAIIHEIKVSLPETIELHDIVSKKPVSIMYYSQMDWYAAADTDATKKEQRITSVPIIIQPFNEIVSVWEKQQTGPNKILIAGKEEEILIIEKELIAQYSDKLNIYKSQPCYLEVMNKQASKTNAIQLLIEKYGIKQEEIIAIGDNYNDKSMIEFAKMGVAMGNAPDEIKNVANYITDTNNNDGVAKALKKFFL